MKLFRRLPIGLCTTALFFLLSPITFAADAKPLTILFTHDLHARLEPERAPDGSPSGGFARLSAVAGKERAGNPGGTLLLDAGDFCSGTLFDSILAKEAPELNAMGAMGYDAVSFGNHDFEAGANNVASELAAVNKDRRPALVISNAVFSPDKPGTAALRNAFSAYPVKSYAVFERSGLRIGVFGLMGRQAASYVHIPGLSFSDPVAAASETVKTLRGTEKCDVVIALSHSGTSVPRADPEKSEDARLAALVPGIDVIISGHTHTRLRQPVKTGRTLIVSSGYWGRDLGVLKLERDPEGGFKAADHALRPVAKGPVDEEIFGMVDRWKARIDELYLAGYGLKYDGTVAYSGFSFTHPVQVETSTEPLAMGDLAADAFRAELKAAEGPAYEYTAAAFMPLGLIKSSLPSGEIRTPDVFRVMPIGAGGDGSAGAPLAVFRLRGSDIARLLEAETTIAKANSDARLETSGVKFSWSVSAPPFARVKEVSLEEPDGTYKPLEKDKLYRVVTSAHAVLYLGLFFAPPIVPLGPGGAPLENAGAATVYIEGKSGRTELKDWVALARYLASFPKTGPGGLPQIPRKYAAPRNSIVVMP